MPRLANTREKIVDRARELLQHRGFGGFSYRDISTDLGIKNAAIHYHFPSKDDLGLALIESFIDEVRARIATARERQVPVRQQLETYFKRAEIEVEGIWSLCPMGAMASCCETLPGPTQRALTRLTDMVLDWLSGTLEQGRREAVFAFEGDPKTKALQISSAIQGARQLSKLRQHNVVAQVADQFRGELYR